MEKADAARLTKEESRLLKALVDAWPEGTSGVALDANAIWLGMQIGMTEAQAVAVIRSLSSKDLIHVRDLHGVLMAHPTPKAMAQLARGDGFIRRIMRGLGGSRTELR